MSGRTPVALTIAGSDSGGGAGIQADLKAFAARGVHGTSAITAITAQNTVDVIAIHAVPAEIVLAQVRAVVADIGVDAVKVGMLGDLETTLAVAAALDELPSGTPVVVDPVMVAESGARLLGEGARQALIAEILPRASVLTPNVPEARALLGGEPLAGADDEQAERLARELLALGPGAVVLTGGHRQAATDVLLERGASQPVQIPGPRHADGAAHGSGCTHAAALAAGLAMGESVEQAARAARRIAGEAVGRGLRDLGAGPGPVDAIGLRARRGG
jgi:hydroxymethylpyrimidine/phosphomethylpyrimidine kinase